MNPLPETHEEDIDPDKLTMRDITLLTYREIKDIKQRLSKAEADIVELRIGAAGQKSFFDGAKAMWGFVLSLPVGLLGLLIGGKA